MIKDYVNLENIPKKGTRYDWSKSVGKHIDGCYKGIRYNFSIENYRRDKYSEIFIEVNGKKDWIDVRRVAKNVMEYFINPLPDFFYNIGDTIIDSKRNLEITNRYYSKKEWNEYSYNIKNYDIHCNSCGYDSIGIEEKALKKNAMCKCCVGAVFVEGKNDVATIYPDSIKYFQGGIEEAKMYQRGSQKRIYPICPICGRVSNKKHIVANIARKGFSCICSDGFSYPEKFMYNILEQLDIDFIWQASKANLNWIKCDYRYDFYVPKYNLIIETDGKQHKEDAWNNNAIDIRENDKNKEIYARKNGNVVFVRIDCSLSNEKYIKNSILNSELKKIFDLDGINFSKANEFALHNSLLIEVANYKKENPLATNGEISKLFKISTVTVRRYLLKGVELGILKQYIKNQHPRGTTYQRLKAREVNSKPVYQFDMDCNFIKKYKSRIDAAEYVNGDPSNISLACKRTKNHKSYKGFLWSDTENCEPYNRNNKSEKYSEIKKKVIEIHNSDKKLSNKKIAKMVGVSDVTVGTYLKEVVGFEY